MKYEDMGWRIEEL